MKKLTLVRHAKSSWKDSSLSDHDRPLNKRGKQDSIRMSKWYAQLNEKPDLLISSTALRARKTMIRFQDAFDINEANVILTRDLYHAYEDEILNVLYGLDDEINSVMLFGHNPGFTYFVNNYSSLSIDNVVTCGITTIEFDVEKWNKIALAPYNFVGYNFPKQIFNEE